MRIGVSKEDRWRMDHGCEKGEECEKEHTR